MIQAFFVWVLGEVLASFLLAAIVMGIIVILAIKFADKVHGK